MGARREGRIAAVQGLYAWEETQAEIEELQRFEWLDKDIGRQAKTFARLLMAGTLEHQEEIDEQIKKNLRTWSFERLIKVDLAILRASVYAMIYQTDIPVSVTIDEAVEMAKLLGSIESHRFVNGVLDGIRIRISS